MPERTRIAFSVYCDAMLRNCKVKKCLHSSSCFQAEFSIRELGDFKLRTVARQVLDTR